MSVRAHDSSQRWVAGPDILAHYVSWSVLLLISDCLKIPSHGPLGRAGQTPSFLGGVRVIHSQQCLYFSFGHGSLLCLEFGSAFMPLTFADVFDASAARMIKLLLVIGFFCDEANISEADIRVADARFQILSVFVCSTLHACVLSFILSMMTHDKNACIILKE